MPRYNPVLDRTSYPIPPVLTLLFLAVTVFVVPLAVQGQQSFERQAPPGTVKLNSTDGQRYVWVPAGTFQMGCLPADSECDRDEKPRHPVTLSGGFWMGQTEVVVSAYERFTQSSEESMPPAPDFDPDWSRKDHPVVRVNWEQAGAFCEWAGGRLPTEAEYEYAARGGQEGLRFPWGDAPGHQFANYRGIEGEDRWEQTAPAGSFPPNAWGLHDLAGNVWEWTADWYGNRYYAKSPSADPQGPSSGVERVMRGGSWFNVPRVLRSSDRFKYVPVAYDASLGFRCVVKDLPEG